MARDGTGIDPGVCAKPFMPGIDPATYAADSGDSFAFLAGSIATYPKVAEEPALRCYVLRSCPDSAG